MVLHQLGGGGGAASVGGGGVLHQLGEEGYNKIIWFYQMS